MIKALSLITICISMVACATVGKFEKRMDAKKGLTKSELINDMGIPAREYKTEDFEILEYYQSDNVNLPRSSTSSIVGSTVLTNTTGGSYSVDCKLEFKLVNGVVTNYRYKGDLCRSN
jgi:hypothetical protein